jgi:hypothetical protein
METTAKNNGNIEVKNFDNEAKAFYTDSINSKVNDILTKHGLDFRIEKLPAFSEFAGVKINTDYFHLLNTKSGNVINSVKGSYTVSQNEDVVRAALIGAEPFGSKLSVSKAGSLNDGRRTFIQFAVEGISKIGNDTVKKYIVLLDSNDGSTGLSVGISDMVMSCQNQFFRFYKAGQSKYIHTVSIIERIKELPSLITFALNETMKQMEIYNKFVSTPATRELTDALVKEMTGIDRLSVNTEKDSTRAINAMNTLYSAIAKETSTKGNTLWGLHNGVTYWTNFQKSVPKRNDGRIESLIVGTNYTTNMKSFNFAMQHANLMLA